MAIVDMDETRIKKLKRMVAISIKNDACAVTIGTEVRGVIRIIPPVYYRIAISTGNVVEPGFNVEIVSAVADGGRLQECFRSSPPVAHCPASSWSSPGRVHTK